LVSFKEESAPRCQRESHAYTDPATGTIDQWRGVGCCTINPAYEKARIAEPKQSRAAMTTPRHAVGATTIDDAIYVAGGGAVTGGSVQSSVHEAFTLGA